MSSMKILLVEDDPAVLATFAQLHGFHVVTAASSAAGMALLEKAGPFAVIVTDLRSSGTDGATFLAEARRRWPDPIGVLLVGPADMSAAATAINDGAIFRFLCKPFDATALEGALRGAVNHHHLAHRERDLLELTLTSAVKMLSEVLAFVMPDAVSRGGRIKQIVVSAARHLGLADSWELPLAAQLAHLGLVTLPHELLERMKSGAPLTAAEQKIASGQASAGAHLIEIIPRLERVAELVRAQDADSETPLDTQLERGAWLLRAAVALDRLIVRGLTPDAAIAALRTTKTHKPEVLAAFDDYIAAGHRQGVQSLRLPELRPGMVVEEDVCTKTGVVLVTTGAELTNALLERLRRLNDAVKIVEPIRVRAHS